MFFISNMLSGNLLLVITLTIASFGVLGMLTAKQTILITLLCVELMYLGVIGTFGTLAVLLEMPIAFLYGLLLLVLAAGESAVGLGILIVLHRCGRGLSWSKYTYLNG